MEDEAFSSIDLVGQCLIDEPRSLAFEKAIKKAVKKNHTVLDVGTGSGIMALFAARAGAEKVFALEYDPFIADTALKNFKNNNFEKKIKLLKGDARDFKYPKDAHFNVVIMEMLTTGMVDEYQIQAINNLHKQKVVDSQTIFIPKIQETYITLTETKFKIYGFEMKMIKHLWNNLSQNQKVKFLSKDALIVASDFSKENNENISQQFEMKVSRNGTLNSVYLSSICHVGDDLKIKDTETLNSPVVIPLEHDFKVQKGDLIKISINYKHGYGYNNFIAKIII